MVITLLSDYGTVDSYVAQAKGLLLQHSYMDHIIDISHAVLPFDIPGGSYILKESYKSFPKKTIHLVLLDLLHRRPAKALILEINAQWIIAADNGFLSFFMDEEEQQNAMVYELPIAANSYEEWIEAVAKIIGKLYGNPHELLEYPKVALPPNQLFLSEIKTDNEIECKVRHIDHYGNLIFGITRQKFDAVGKGRKFRITLRNNKTITNLVEHYQDVNTFEPLARFNSIGYLEIAMRNARADEAFGYKLFNKDQIFYTTINITFHDH